MKKKTNIIKTLFLSMVCSITIGLQSCGDYLDVEEYIDQMTFLDSVFSRKELLDQYINGAAHIYPMKANFGQILLHRSRLLLMRISCPGMIASTTA